MAILQGLLGFVGLVCFVLMIVGLWKPATVLRKVVRPSRGKAFLVYFVAFLIVGSLARLVEERRIATDPAYAQAVRERELAKKKEAKDAEAKRQAMQKAETDKAKEEAAKREVVPKGEEGRPQSQKIGVQSQIVKAVARKYRYFFAIRNHGQTPFEGSVTIELKGRNGTLGRETFTTRQPIAPGLGTSVYFDINTGPPSVHGEYGIMEFSYGVEVAGQIVASGRGLISEKFENLRF
ncbi:MAG: hypothetical protein HY235_03275 [Acidobacteria bacterium]|nr:hypothetical protein [Acidobacteriota bacterium]